MAGIFVGFLFLVLGGFLLFSKNVGATQPGGLTRRLGGAGRRVVGGGMMAVGLLLIASTSFVFVGADQVGHLKRIYAFKELPEGRIIAKDGEKGPQARILGPGFHVIPLVRVLYDFEEWPVITIPEGSYGQLTALDGAPMPEGMFIAPAIPDNEVAAMLDAGTFLDRGGYRGPQETVLKPGSYRLNRYLFDLRLDETTSATQVPAGHVAVIKSNVETPGTNCVEEEVSATKATTEGLTVPLVPRGCVGIWKEPLLPGAYYLNRRAYEVTLVDTRVQTWEYKGGYVKRIIDLSINQVGDIQQKERSVDERVPDYAADRAVFVKVEGWDIPLELRALVQVSPENAPIVVGSVGGLEQIENRILTPAIRSIVRNVAGSNVRVPVTVEDGSRRYETRPTRVLDLIENREALEETIEALIKIEGSKAGVDIREIRLGEPAIPPELLVSRLRQQLADQLSQAYKRETEAQEQRIQTEQARSTADEQPRLVAAQIAVQVANQREQEREALGRAERKYLEEVAQGQFAQVNVLGQDRVALLQALEKMLITLEKKPELVQLVSRLVPQTVVSDSGDSLAGAAAILSGVLNREEREISGPVTTPAQAQ